MTLIRILTVVLGVLLPIMAVGQATMTGDLTVRSIPEGAQVTLKGEAILSGVTPVRFEHLLIGDYDLALNLHGYETYRLRVFLDPTKQMVVDVRLSPKTRFKAAARSLFIPGWGQRYAGQKGKGYAYTLLAVGSVVAYLFADARFDNKREEYNEIKHTYDSLANGGNIAHLREWRPLLEEAQEDAFEAENIRRGTIGAAIGIWGLNVIDAIFFFPKRRAQFTVKGITLQPSNSLEHPGITLSLAL